MYPQPPRNHEPFRDLIWSQGPHLRGNVTWDYLLVAGEWAALALGLAIALWLSGRLLARHPSRPVPPARAPARGLGPELAFCLLIGALGAWLRMGGLLLEPLEIQEASEIYPIYQEHWGLLAVIFLPNKMEPHQFLFPLSLYPLRDLVADVRMLRYLPAALGALVPILSHLLLRGLRFPRSECMVVGLAMALSPFHVYFSRLMLPYVMANVCFLLLLLGAIAYAGRGEPGRGRRLLFVLAANLAMATHFATVLFGGFLVAALILTTPIPRNRLLLVRDTLIASLLFLPFAGRSLVYLLQPASLSPHQLLIDTEMFVQRPLLPEMLSYFRYTLSAAAGLIDAGTSAGLRSLTAVGWAAATAAGCVALLRRSRLQAAAVAVPALVFLAFLTILGPAGIYLKQEGIYFPPRRLVLLYPFLVVLPIAGFFALTRLARGAAWLIRAPVLLVILLGWSMASLHLQREATLPDGVGAGRILQQELRDGDGILVGPATWMRWIVLAGLLPRDDLRWISQLDTADFFELKRERDPFPADVPAPGIMINMPETYAFAETHLQRERLERVWLVHIWQHTAGWPEIVREHDHQETLRELLKQHFRPVQRHSLRSIELTAYERVSRPPPPADGYEVRLGPMGHPFVSLTWPPPAVPTAGDHERHFLAGGRLDLPLPGPGRWEVEIEARVEDDTQLGPATFLWGDPQRGYRKHHLMLDDEWSWLRYPASAEEGAALPRFVWEFRPPGARRPMATDTWERILRIREDYLGTSPLQLRRVRVRPLGEKGPQRDERPLRRE